MGGTENIKKYEAAKEYTRTGEVRKVTDFNLNVSLKKRLKNKRSNRAASGNSSIKLSDMDHNIFPSISTSVLLSHLDESTSTNLSFW